MGSDRVINIKKNRINLIKTLTFHKKLEGILVGRVPPASAVPCRLRSQEGTVPGGYSPGGMVLGGMVIVGYGPRGYGGKAIPPPEQTDTCRNITFQQLRLWVVIRNWRHHLWSWRLCLVENPRSSTAWF